VTEPGGTWISDVFDSTWTRVFPSIAVAEKVVFPRMLKNAQMQGSRNPEE
jgi:hypothetical protein